jgi:hypothetical protein
MQEIVATLALDAPLNRWYRLPPYILVSPSPLRLFDLNTDT